MVQPHRPQPLLDWIASDLDGLSPSFRAIGRFLLANHAVLQHMQIGDVASRCGTADSTVVRFARRFGHSGYPDLKLALLLASAASGAGAGPSPGNRPAPDQRPGDTRTDALVGRVEEAVHRLNGLKVVVQSPEFLNIAKQLRHAACFTLSYGGEYDRLVAMYLGDALEQAGKTVMLTDRLVQRITPRHEASGITVAIHLESLAQDGAAKPPAMTLGTPQLSLIGTTGMPMPSITPPVIWVAGNSLGHRAQTAMTLSDALVGALA